MKEHFNYARRFLYHTDRSDNRVGVSRKWNGFGALSWTANFHGNVWNGEFRSYAPEGTLVSHILYQNGSDPIIDFLENPELYPKTEEDFVYFTMKYPDCPLVDESLIMTWQEFLDSRPDLIPEN